MDDRQTLYIDGAWVPSSGSGRLDVIDATTEEVLGHVPEGTTADVDRAVAAARNAFLEWSQTPVEERARLLAAVAAGLEARADEIATVISREVGMPKKLSRRIQVGLPILTFSNTAELIRSHPFEERVGNSLIVKEAVGVVAAITPWNYPLHQTASKVAPALAAGCTVVLKPAAAAPFSAFHLAEVIHEAGFPAGVFNLVSGAGRVVGEALASHPEVDMVSFTGSTPAGKRVSELALQTVKRVALELGGKSANVILDDADLEKAVTGGVANAFLNSGQTCSALTRMLVPRSMLKEVEEIAVRATERYVPGNPLDDSTRLGPLATADQRDTVRQYIRTGLDEGATLLVGGAEPPDGLDTGYFVRPTIFSDVDNAMTIAQEEIFGPVLVIIPFDSEDDAVAIANDSIYGLTGGVWSADPERAQRVARRIRTGQVDINGAAFNPLAPFGGFKQSGHGRELGAAGLDEFLETKSLQLPPEQVQQG